MKIKVMTVTRYFKDFPGGSPPEFDIPDDATVINVKTSWIRNDTAQVITLTYWVPVKDHWDNDKERG